MFLIIYFLLLSTIMYTMNKDLKEYNQKLKFKFIIIIIYIVQCIGIIGRNFKQFFPEI